MRIAYFSPLNPRNTGISDYSEELLPALAEHATIDLFVDGYEPSNPTIRERFAIHDCAEFATRRAEHRYDVNLYQMGNSLHHAAIYRMLLRYPGIVVLHDVVLHHFFLELANHQKDPSLYLRELAYAHGAAGVETGLAVWHGREPAPLFDDPLIGRVVQASLGVIVHSEYARRRVGALAPSEVAVVPAQIKAPPAAPLADRAIARSEVGLAPSTIVFGAFGQATRAKRLDVALRAFSRLHRLIPDTRLLVVGQIDPPGWLDGLIAELDLGEAVTLTGPVSFDRFQRYIFATDACLNLRYPTAGETSASLLRIMAAGLPAIVSDVGSFAEFPDECCRKVPVDGAEEEQLFVTMRALARDRDLRGRIGDAARRRVLASHTPERTARGYADFLERIVYGVYTSTLPNGTPEEAVPPIA